MPDRTVITVPATTANIGPGFDCLGAALTLYNRFEFRQISGAAGSVTIQVEGAEADRVSRDASNLAYQAFMRAFQHLQRPVPAIALHIHLGVPLARGLGSSSTAIVAGLMGANQFAGRPFSSAELITLATTIEGHPDNVVPALVGGCQLAAATDSGAWCLCPIPWHPEIVPVVAIPNFELSTAAARQVLPDRYSRADAIFNTAHGGLLIRALETGNADWLTVAMEDRIHQPYRQALIPGYAAVRSAAIAAGAYGLVISGAGPTLLALTDADHCQPVQTAMTQAWSAAGIEAIAHILEIDPQGAIASNPDAMP